METLVLEDVGTLESLDRFDMHGGIKREKISLSLFSNIILR